MHRLLESQKLLLSAERVRAYEALLAKPETAAILNGRTNSQLSWVSTLHHIGKRADNDRQRYEFTTTGIYNNDEVVTFLIELTVEGNRSRLGDYTSFFLSGSGNQALNGEALSASRGGTVILDED